MYKLYDHDLQEAMLELSDERVMWRIDTKGHPFDESRYRAILDVLVEQFEKTFKTEVFFEGRSGRHVCVKNTKENRKNYDKMVRWTNSAIDYFVAQVNTYYEYYEEPKNTVFLLQMISNDPDYPGQEIEQFAFSSRDKAKEEFERRVKIELSDKDMSWVAEAYDNGNYDPKEYEFIKTDTYFSFELRGWDKSVVWHFFGIEVL